MFICDEMTRNDTWMVFKWQLDMDNGMIASHNLYIIHMYHSIFSLCHDKISSTCIIPQLNKFWVLRWNVDWCQTIFGIDPSQVIIELSVDKGNWEAFFVQIHTNIHAWNKIENLFLKTKNRYLAFCVDWCVHARWWHVSAYSKKLYGAWILQQSILYHDEPVLHYDEISGIATQNREPSPQRGIL